MGEKVYRVLAGKNHYESLRHRWDDNIKIDRGEIG
jgi:hypothetical protein